jgi:hypothetical protein
VLSRHAKLSGAAVCAGALMLPVPSSAQAVVAVDREQVLDPLVEMTERAHDRAVRRNVQLQRTNAELRGVRADRGRKAELSDWTLEHVRDRSTELRRENRRLRRAAARARRAAAAAGTPVAAAGAAGGATATPGHLQAIAACESGGNPSAVGGGGAYRGKYQFSPSTWASVGGSGDPAAASEAEQDQRAAALYAQQGSSPWPTCG